MVEMGKISIRHQPRQIVSKILLSPISTKELGLLVCACHPSLEDDSLGSKLAQAKT
jgi:hypothetical protein